MARRTRWGILILAMALAVQAVALVSYANDRRYLEALFDRIADPSLPPSEQAKRVVLLLRDKSTDTGHSSFLLPVLAFLRPTARQVAEEGKDCADRSRL